MNGRAWSEDDLAVLAEQYPIAPTKQIAKALDRCIYSVYNKALALGLRKSKEFLDSPEGGRLRKGQCRPGMEKTQFTKGHVPANKGLRRPGWAPGRMRETQFRKGQRSGRAAKNWKPIGTILADSDGYLRIKVREAVYGKEPCGFGNTKVWPLLQRHIWEQYHGPIPPKHLVVFKNGDRANCAIDNLELISMADNARRNSMWRRLPRELAQVIQLNGVLKRKIGAIHGQK
jgi:hypothetical protein